jgi:hypothetical protein
MAGVEAKGRDVAGMVNLAAGLIVRFFNGYRIAPEVGRNRREAPRRFHCGSYPATERTCNRASYPATRQSRLAQSVASWP